MITILYGPTASGKSALAIEWASAQGGAEKGAAIVNADALQIYDALPILTAQPNVHDRSLARHELYGVVNPQAPPMTAALWAQMAADILADIAKPIVVGGTGLYIKTLIDGIAPIPDSDPALRAELEAEYLSTGPDAFQRLLEAVDPASARQIEPNNRQRMVRALEVYRQTGRSLSAWHKEPKKTFLPAGRPIRLIVFLPEKNWVAKRAGIRVDGMLAAGALAEVTQFAQTYGPDAPAAKALGFGALWDQAQGLLTPPEARARMIADTNAYIKRQLTWGRTQLASRPDARLAVNAREVGEALYAHGV